MVTWRKSVSTIANVSKLLLLGNDKDTNILHMWRKLCINNPKVAKFLRTKVRSDMNSNVWCNVPLCTVQWNTWFNFAIVKISKVCADQ